MDVPKTWKDVFEEDSESLDEDSLTMSLDYDSDSNNSFISEEETDVAFLFLRKYMDEEHMIAKINVDEQDKAKPYKVIDELMQPK